MSLPKIESKFELDHSSNCPILQAQEGWVTGPTSHSKLVAKIKPEP